MYSLSKEQSVLSRKTTQNAFFFSELCPFFDLDFLSSIKNPTAEHLHLHAVLLFYYEFVFENGHIGNTHALFILEFVMPKA